MLVEKYDILCAIVNNIKNWDFDVRSSLSFEKEECMMIYELANKELLELRRIQNADKQ